MEHINYFHAGHLMSEAYEITGIDFTYEEEHRKKFYNLTKQEARELLHVMRVRPHILKDYIFKNIINDKPF
ncbi:MAG: hypothetical protein JSS91_00895 [Bacteroidetes bacterium]|nr:hypothetical protein [Bacteroidota bacterium]